MSVLSALLGTALRPLGRRAPARNAAAGLPPWISTPLPAPGANPLLLTRFAAALTAWARAPSPSAEEQLLGTISERLRIQWSLLSPDQPLAPLRELCATVGPSSRLILSEAKGEPILLVLAETDEGEWRARGHLRFASQAGKIASIQFVAAA